MHNMMGRVGLFECQTVGEYFIWSNRHKHDLICSRIDHVLGNIVWFVKYVLCKIEVLPSHISDQCPLLIEIEIPAVARKIKFKL